MVESGPVGRKMRDAEEGRGPELCEACFGWFHSLSLPFDSLLLRDFRGSAQQGDRPSEDPLTLAAALHLG